MAEEKGKIKEKKERKQKRCKKKENVTEIR